MEDNLLFIFINRKLSHSSIENIALLSMAGTLLDNPCTINLLPLLTTQHLHHPSLLHPFIMVNPSILQLLFFLIVVPHVRSVGRSAIKHWIATIGWTFPFKASIHLLN